MGRAYRSSREEAARRAGTLAAGVQCTLFALVTATALAACSDEAQQEPEALGQVQPSKPTLHEATWLKVTDGIAPEKWLASREARRDLNLDDDAVVDMRKVLDVASARFRDQPRMIANRAVQLESMLSEKSIYERAPRLIVTLSQVPGSRRSVESFAALTQQYYNLRLEGLGQGAALEALKKQLGPMASESNDP